MFAATKRRAWGGILFDCCAAGRLSYTDVFDETVAEARLGQNTQRGSRKKGMRVGGARHEGYGVCLRREVRLDKQSGNIGRGSSTPIWSQQAVAVWFQSAISAAMNSSGLVKLIVREQHWGDKGRTTIHQASSDMAQRG